jgi:hypothetical protein
LAPPSNHDGGRLGCAPYKEAFTRAREGAIVLPLLLIILATLSAGFAVFGTLPQWMLLDHGMQIITAARRLEWPLLTFSIVCCSVLLVLVGMRKQRALWLLGLAPVLAMLGQLFLNGTSGRWRVVDQPTLTAASEARFMDDTEYVVGLVFNGEPYAFPYRQLYNSPVVTMQNREKRMLLMWSAYANRAMAFHVTRQIKPRELDIVSMPANALLLYNSRVGQFINGLTGLTPDGKSPHDLLERIPVAKVTWGQWHAWHPNTQVTALPTFSNAARAPIMPQYPMKVTQGLKLPAETPVVVFATTQPVAIEQKRIGEKPLNTYLGKQPILILRDPTTGQMKAFSRVYGDYVSRFVANFSPTRAAKGVVLLDGETNSGWNAAGIAIDGDKQVVGKKLDAITTFEDSLYYGVMKQWYPDLELSSQ